MTPRTRIIIAAVAVVGLLVIGFISHKASTSSRSAGRGPQILNGTWLDEEGYLLTGEYIYDDENSSFSQPRVYNWTDVVHHLSPLREVYHRHNSSFVEEFLKNNHTTLQQQGALYPLIH